MENQHRKVSGYRELSQQEIDLMNEIKALGPQIEAVIIRVQNHLNQQAEDCVVLGATEEAKVLTKRLDDATPHRFTALAKTDFQTALMYLTRAVAQPTFF